MKDQEVAALVKHRLDQAQAEDAHKKAARFVDAVKSYLLGSEAG